MDFLVLMTIYVTVFGVCVLLYVYGDSPALANGAIGRLRHVLMEIVTFVIPQRFTDAAHEKLYNVLHTRNQVLQFVFAAIVLLGHAVWVKDMLPILYMSDPNANHTLMPMVVVFTNLFFFHKSCSSDPGEINPAKQELYSQVYKFDMRLYLPNRICSTCDLPKPARSKHCNICNRCVHRFDHHCVWTNNDVGGLNHRYFLLFLLTLVGMAIEGVVVGGWSLWLYTRNSRLLEARVLMDDGETMPVNVFVVFQHLFLQYPRLVFLVVALVVLIPMIGSFAIYHTFLVLTNQTTNERYKTPAAENLQDEKSISKRTNKSSSQKLNRKSNKTPAIDQVHGSHRPYHRGILKNVQEVFFLDNLKRSKQR
ncbi:probable palmitoyltransferase ZDHHC4 [Mizuhopecten yessoensis]|uniref:Palmitoyltransferase n=1 Tax=Mizuhopecten yessoensis TaxID=6573 RepID=A0A210QES0_MIZYE|nr:probable palmitoyltransferase ZDHHC4 [Mizuhopecten yessoensis]XP_021359895.1 probable palmitoyltransferase ZDHHC4 [Mizuhopecten yessoensis]OWF47250.1 palmitoyltransferase ZDHHC4 [Mizuhopecten yessoensis]